ncbi:MAG TPA: alpha/beta hydrolase-fold protein [Rhizomicrobium sp.]|nr:alpha/beta hydrolase-fold protein [Rhizomicrobium sp.]
MRRRSVVSAGYVERHVVQSTLLKNNFLGDPSERAIDIYLPFGMSPAGLPLLVDLVGFTAGGPAHTNWKNFSENMPERLDRLIGTGMMPPCVVMFPDCFTKLGGNQYINSKAMGPWADVLMKEFVPIIEHRYACGGRGKRGVFGKSSGGYGAIVHALLSPDFWSAAACHSGDMGFEHCYLGEFPRLLRALAKQGGSIGKWIDAFYAAPKTKDGDVHDLMTLAMCASYDPDTSQPYGVRLPVDPYTCELIPERWKNFEAWDPLTLVETRGRDLRLMKAVYIDCGDVDQYDLVYGARRFHRALERLGVAHTYEEFPDDHSSVDYRMDKSLPLLAKALSG